MSNASATHFYHLDIFYFHRKVSYYSIIYFLLLKVLLNLYGINLQSMSLCHFVWQYYLTNVTSLILQSEFPWRTADKCPSGTIGFSPPVSPYSTVLYCNFLYSSVLYCTLLYSTELYCTLLYSTVGLLSTLYSEYSHWRPNKSRNRNFHLVAWLNYVHKNYLVSKKNCCNLERT